MPKEHFARLNAEQEEKGKDIREPEKRRRRFAETAEPGNYSRQVFGYICVQHTKNRGEKHFHPPRILQLLAARFKVPVTGMRDAG